MSEGDQDDVSASETRLLELVTGELPADCVERVRFACGLARRAHAGQTRDEGLPYVLHPLGVAMGLAEDLEAIRVDAALLAEAEPCDLLVIALLHDVLEDAPDAVTHAEWLQAGERVVEGVQLLTRTKDMAKVAYYHRLGAAPLHVRLVKFADRLDNLSAIGRSPVPGKRQKKVAETADLVLPLLEDPTSPVLVVYAERLRTLVHRLAKEP